MKHTSTGAIISIVIFYAILIVFVIFVVSQGGYKPILAITIFVMLILVDYQMKRELPEPIRKKPVLLIPEDKIFGTFEDKEPIQAGKVLVTASFPKRYVRKMEYFRSSGFLGIFSHLSGRVQIKFKCDEHQLVESNTVNCLAPEGGYVFTGSLTGREVVGEHQQLKRELDQAIARIREQQSAYEGYMERAGSIMRNNSLDGKEAIKDMSIAMKDLSGAFAITKNPSDLNDLHKRN